MDKSFLEKYDIKLNEYIIVGVSGGADSMCLLHKMSKIYDKIVAVHVNHNLRGAEAERDENFVRNYCVKNNLIFEKKNVDVNKYMKEHKSTVEEAARILRFKALNEVAAIYKAEYIFLAHNADDVCETFFINLFRGTGIQGLCGIEEKRGNIIRPLLSMKRSEIEAYNEEYGVEFIHDSTNFENEYTRNKIRNKLLPFIEENINPKARDNIYKAIMSLKEYRNYFDECIEPYKKLILFEDGRAKIYFKDIDDIILKELLRKAIDALVGLKDISKEHIDNIFELSKKNRPISINLPKECIAKREKDYIIIGKKEKIYDELNIYLEDIKEEITVNGISFKKVSKSLGENCLSYDKIKRGQLRYRGNGDFLLLNKKVKLKDYLIKRKVDIFSRDKLAVISIGRQIVWIEGLFIDPKFIAVNEEGIEIRRRCER